MGTASDTPTDGLSRRDALKRGFKLTGAVLWATPVLQVVNMTKAAAQVTSGPVVDPDDGPVVDPPVVDPVVLSKVCYAVRVNKSSRGAFCIDVSGQHRHGRHGRWHDVDEFDQAPGSGGCGLIDAKRTPKSGAWKVVLREGVEAIDVSGFSYLKGRKGGRRFSGVTFDEATRTLTFTPPRRRAISNVQFYFCVTVES